MKSSDEIVLKIKQLIERITEGRVKAAGIKLENELIKDLGLDSIDFAAVMLGCEDWVGIKINESAINWADIRTVATLADLFIDRERKTIK